MVIEAYSLMLQDVSKSDVLPLVIGFKYHL